MDIVAQSVSPELVKHWLQEEGLFFQDQHKDAVIAQWAIKVPIDIQQSINMSVLIPKGKQDQVIATFSIIPGEPAQKLFAALTDERKQSLVRQLVEEFLKLGFLPVFGLQPDGKFNITLSASIFHDAPLTKHVLIGAVNKLRNSFLFYEVIQERIFKPYGLADELLKP